MSLFTRIIILNDVKDEKIVIKLKINRSFNKSFTFDFKSLLFALTLLAFTEMRNTLNAYKLVALNVRSSALNVNKEELNKEDAIVNDEINIYLIS